jgi:hypothetical protein
MAGIEQMDETTAASLILYALARKVGKSATKKRLLRSEKQAWDIIANPIHSGQAGYVGFTFFAVTTGKAKSAPRALGELILKDIVKKLFDHVVGDMSPAYEMAGTFDSAAKAGSIDTKEIYATATKVGGAMQLHAAKKMGKEVYDMARVYGLSAHVNYCGVAVFEEKKKSGSPAQMKVHIRAWNSLIRGAGFLDQWQGRASGRQKPALSDITKWGGDAGDIDYTYNPATGEFS